MCDSIYDNVVKPYAEPSRDQLLPDTPQSIKGKEKPTLVVSLDGTLIESSWTRQYGWRYIKRPYVDDFLKSLAPYYELVMWTESMNTADPVVERLDPRRLFRHRLYRDATRYTGGIHVKDLDTLNRDMNKCLIIDCDAKCFSLQPKHGIEIPKYVSEDDPDKKDRALLRLIPLLQFLARSQAAAAKASPNSSTCLADELDGYRQAGDGDPAAAFEKRVAELRAAGKLGALGAAGVRDTRPSGPTLWDRLRGPK